MRKGKKVANKFMKGMAMVMAFVLLITSADLSAVAMGIEGETYYQLTQIGEVNTRIDVSYGTSEEELKLQETVNTMADVFLVETGELLREEVVDLPITYTCDEYDPFAAGEYVFKAEFPNEYKGETVYAMEFALPEITVRVLEAKELLLSQVVDGIEVTLEAAAGVFPENVTLSVEKVSDAQTQKISEAVKGEIEGKSTSDEQFTAGDVIVFDIKVMDANGQEVQPRIPDGMTNEDAIKVTFKNAAQVLMDTYGSEAPMTDYSLDVFHVDDNIQDITFMQTTVEGEDLAISPEHFSLYGCSCSMSNVKSVYTWKEMYKAIWSNGVENVRMKSNITISTLGWSLCSGYLYLIESRTINLDLNGYTLSSSESGSAAIVVSNGKLRIHDKSSSGNGKISAPYCTNVIKMIGGDVELTGGTIYRGGREENGIWVGSYYSEFTMNGGRIYGRFDDAIEIDSSITGNTSYDMVRITGGIIDGANYGIYSGGSTVKKVTVSGGTFQNIRYYSIYNGCLKLYVTGGSFNGYSSGKPYGIYVTNKGTLNLSGAVSFSNNKGADIYVGKSVDNVINLTGNLGDATRISIATYKTPTVDENGGAQFTSANHYAINNKDKFYSAVNSGYVPYKLSSENYLRIGPMPNCKLIVKPLIQGVVLPNTTLSGSAVTAQQVGYVAIGSSASTYEMAGQTQTVKYNTPITLKATLVDTENYTFLGWKSEKQGTIIDTKYNFSFDAQDSDTYYAVFARKSYGIGIRSSSANMGTVKFVSYTINDVAQSISTAETTSIISHTAEQGGKVTIQALPKTNSDTGREYVFAQWDDGNKENPRVVEVSEARNYIAQFREPDPDPDATGILFIGVQPLKPSALNYAGTAEDPVPEKVILIDKASGVMPNTDGLFAIAGLPANSARLSILTTSKAVNRATGGSTETLGVTDTDYNTAQVADMADASVHNSTTATTGMGIKYKGEENGSNYTNETSSVPSKGFGYYVLIDLKDPSTNTWDGPNLYKGEAFDTCPGGWIGFSTTCGYWHYWCNNGGVQAAGPYNAYSYTKSVNFTAWAKDEDGNLVEPRVSNISVKVNDIRLENETSVKSANLTIDIKAEDGVVYRLANVVFTGAEINGVAEGAQINFANGDKVVDFNLNGVAFSHTLPEAIIARGGEESTDRTEYLTIREALENAVSGDVVYVYGPAISEIIGEGVEVAEGVRIISYDGTEINLNNGDANISADSDGTLNLMDGAMTVIPPTDENGNTEDITVGVGQGTVSTDEKIIVSTQNGGEVTTTAPTQEVVISPDGDPNHTVVFKGCESDKTYGMGTGNYTTETEVEISAGTEYDLVVPNGTNVDGSENHTTITTNSNNTGSTIVNRENTGNGSTQTVITTEKENDSVEISGSKFSATEDNTQIAVSPEKENPVLSAGGVEVQPESSIELPNGNIIKNTGAADGSNSSIEANADGSVSVPNGGKVEIESANGDVFEVHVPDTTLNPDGTVNEDAALNMPSKITTSPSGTPVVETPGGSSVIIGDPSDPNNYYEAGEYDTKFEVTGNGDVQVTNGSVVLKPGQSVIDSNGTVFTNNGDTPLNIVTDENGDTQVEVPSDGSFQYTPAGSSTPIQYENPGSSEASLNVGGDGQMNVESELSVPGNKNVNVNLNGVDTTIKTPSTNQGEVTIDPIGGTVTVQQAGDKVTIGTTEYTAKENETILIPMGSDGVSLGQGAVGLDKNESIIVSGTNIGNAGNSALDVKVNANESNPENTTSTVSVPSGGSFSMSEPGGSNKVVISNTTGSLNDYELNMEGALLLPANGELAFSQNGKTTSMVAGASGAEVKPTEDGVSITVPTGGSVTIGGCQYVNADPNRELNIMVDKEGKVVLVSGSINMGPDASINLADGTAITNEGDSMSLDAHGNMSIPQDGSVSIAPPGKTSSTYEAKDGQLDLSYDPEIQIPTIESGCTEIGPNASIDVVFNTISITENDVDADGQPTGETSVYERDQHVTITSTGSAPVTVDKTNGTITVPQNGTIKVDSEKVNEDGTVTETTNTISVPNGASNDSVAVTPNTDGSVDVLLDAEGSKVTVNNVEYTATKDNTEINVAENGSTLISGGVKLDGGKNPKEGIIANGNLITNLGGTGKDVSVEILDNGNTAFDVSAGGQFSIALPGDSSSSVVFKNPASDASGYEMDTNGNIAIGENSSISFTAGTNNVVVEGGEGVSIKVTEDGVAIRAEGTNPVTIGGVTYQPTGAGVTIVIDKNGRPIITEGEAEIPFNTSVYVKDAEDNLVEVKKTGYVEDAMNPDASKLTVGADGTVSGLAGDTIKIGSGTYESLDEAGAFELDFDAQTGDVTVTEGSALKVTNGNATLGGVNIASKGNKPVSAELPAGSSKPNVVVSPGGNATIKAPGSDEVLEIKVPSTEAGEKEITMDNSSNLSVQLQEGEKITIGGATYTAQQAGQITVNATTGQLVSSTITPAGSEPVVSIDSASFNQPNYSYTIPAGTSVKVDGVTYTAPEGCDMVLSGNPSGKPIVSVSQSGSTVTIGGVTFTTAADNTNFVVKGTNNVVLVDNGNPSANSALKVDGNKNMVVNGNTIVSSGNANASYVIQMTPDGDKLTLEDGTKVSVTVGSAGTDIIINEDLSYGTTTVSKPVKITANGAGNSFVIDKSIADASGNYNAKFGLGESTNLSFVKDASGNVIAFETTTKANTPTYTPPVTPPAEETPEEETAEEETAEEENVTEEEIQDVTEEEAEDIEEVDPEEGEPSEDEEDSEDVAEPDEPESEPSKEEEDEKAPEEDSDADEETLAKETVEIQVEKIDEIKDVNITGNAVVTMGQGTIVIESGNNGQAATITGDLKTIIEAILPKKDIKAVEEGATVVIRLNVVRIEETTQEEAEPDNNQKELQEIREEFPKYQKEIEGLTMVEGYDILVEKSVNGAEWQTVSELNDEVEITMMIPKELRKEGRTFFMLHNHECKISILDDLDDELDTITIKTVKFSAYVISYTDADVADISVEKVNATVNGMAPVYKVSLAISLVLLLLSTGFVIYKKKKRR